MIKLGKAKPRPWKIVSTEHGDEVRDANGDIVVYFDLGNNRVLWPGIVTAVNAYEPLTAALEAAREALETIVDLERHTRSGGATHDDLASYEEGLDTAIEIAAAALAALAAITKAQGVGRGMSADRYYARSASDRTNDWPFWFVADKSRGGLNVTAELIRQYSYEPINRMAPVPILLSKKLARRLVEHIKEMQHAV